MMGDFLETKIREYRNKKGLTQQELADAVGVTRQTINALENARYNPSLVLAYRISKVLDKDSIEDVFILGTEDLL
jgi:putative transcriptional regulator